MSEETIYATMAEACALLNVDEPDLKRVMFGPEDRAPTHVTLRQILAARIAFELASVLSIELATKVGVTAGTDAREGGGRLLVVTLADAEPRALWREADAGFNISKPALLVPADAWLAGVAAQLAEHRASAARPN